MSKFLEQIKEVNDLKAITVTVEDWGFDVELLEPCVAEILSAQKLFTDADGNIDAEKSVFEVLAICIAEDGKRVFKDSKSCKAALGNKSQRALMKLVTAAQGLIQVDAEETEKN